MLVHSVTTPGRLAGYPAHHTIHYTLQLNVTSLAPV